MIKTSTVQLSDLRKQESAAHSRSRVEAGKHSRDRAAASAHSEAGLRLVHTVKRRGGLCARLYISLTAGTSG